MKILIIRLLYPKAIQLYLMVFRIFLESSTKIKINKYAWYGVCIYAFKIERF